MYALLHRILPIITIGSLFIGCVPSSTPEPMTIATNTPSTTVASTVTPTLMPTPLSLPTPSTTVASTMTPTPMPSPLSLPTPRITALQVDQNDRAELVDGNRAFALDLYHVLRKGSGNLFYSPYSISLALAMAYAGARGKTQQQMAGALHFTLSPDRLHPAFHALDLEIARRGESTDKGFHLNIANAMWVQQGYALRDEYLGLLAENYGAAPHLVDFEHAFEAARITINAWVSEKTQGKIKDLIPKGAVNDLTRLVLTNAIYFKAAWQDQFDESGTRKEPFHLLGGGQISVPMMHQLKSFGYTEGAEYQAVTLRYNGAPLAMIVLLPRAGQFSAFEDSLSTQRLKAILGAMQPQDVRLTLPKFKVESEFSLKDVLEQLGMTDAFGGAADFSGMTGRPELCITSVFHQAYIAVDEAGTEAAAATAVIMGGGGLATPSLFIEFTADRPFLFLIQDEATGAILFVGRVLDPRP